VRSRLDRRVDLEVGGVGAHASIVGPLGRSRNEGQAGLTGAVGIPGCVGDLALLGPCAAPEARVSAPSRGFLRPPHNPRSRAISIFMISLEPAQILVTRASRQARATRYSFM
jgi:hypothetical protein